MMNRRSRLRAFLPRNLRNKLEKNINAEIDF